MTVSMTVADHTVNLLAAWGADTVFGVPGDTVLPILEGIRKEGTVRFIATRNETAAGLMASAYAKVSGRPPVRTTAWSSITRISPSSRRPAGAPASPSPARRNLSPPWTRPCGAGGRRSWT